MKVNQWTLGLAATGVISLASAVQAEEAKNQVLTAVSATTLSGYVSTSAQWNPASNINNVAAYSYGAGKGDGFNVNLVDITISKNAGEGDWAAGYKAELWLGPDAAGIGTATGGSSLAIKQAYVQLRAPIGNGLDLKLGSFDTIVGYESANAGDNPNFTRSYGYTIEPTQHTGLLASYRFGDSVSASVGIANTYTAATAGRAANQSQKTYMASVTLTAPDSLGFLKGGTLTAGVVDGRAAGGLANPDQTLVYVGATVPTGIDGFTLGASFDHLNRSGPAAAGVVGSVVDVDAFAVYGSIKLSDKCKLNVRAEYLDNNANALGLAGHGGSTAATLAGSEIGSLTATVDYALWENVVSRVEYRLDHDLSGNRNLSAAGKGANNAHILALNLIYKF